MAPMQATTSIVVVDWLELYSFVTTRTENMERTMHKQGLW